MSRCSSSEEHCCHLGRGGICPYLRANEGGRRWACALMLEHGDWDKVHSDERYQQDVKPYWVERGFDTDCGNWPAPGETCGACGEVG